MSTYEDLPGNHLISIHNLITSTLDDSYPEFVDEGYVFVRGRAAPEWDYSGVPDREAFLLFQAAADYYLTYSDDSSEGHYDPTHECFIVELAEQNDDAPNDAANPPVIPTAPRPAASANLGLRQAQLA